MIENRINVMDAKKDEYLKELFFEQNIKLVYKAVNDLKSVHIDRDEKISLGRFGLVVAFNTYDENSGFAFSTYAMRCITNEILMENRKISNKHRQKALSLEGVVGRDSSDNELFLQDILSTPEEDYGNYDYILIKEVYKKFVEIYSKQDPRLVRVFDLYVLQNIPTQDIGDELGHNQSTISRLVPKVIKAIQEIAIEMEVIENFSRYARKSKAGNNKTLKKAASTVQVKRRALYIILNYPELDYHDVSKIVNFDIKKVSRIKESYNKGTFDFSPDESVKSKAEEYLANKKLYS